MERTAVAALTLALGACASYGPTVSQTSGLGYSRPAYGALAHYESDANRVEIRAVSIEKNDGGTGWAIAGHALLDLAQHHEWSLLVGCDGAHQQVENYTTDRLSPRVEIGYRSLALYWIGPDRKIEQILGIRALYRQKLLLEAENVTHTEGHGARFAVSWLWRKP